MSKQQSDESASWSLLGGGAMRSLDDRTVSRLARLGLGASGRPIDALIDRLEQEDADRWLGAAARSEPLSRLLGPDLDRIRSVGRDELEEIKDQSKRLAASRVADERLRGMLGYFLGLAAGRLQYGVWMSSQSPERIAADVGDLATVLKGRLQMELARAATG